MARTVFQFAFSLFSVAQIAKLLGYDDLIPFAGSGQLGADKLFLDGLVSVWQVEPH